MRLGIITPYDSANYGAFLQAYANMRFLKSLGYEVFFIKFRSEDQREKVFFPPRKSLKGKLQAYVRRGHISKNYTIMTNALECFSVIDVMDIYCAKLDGIILGSDEIWNVKVGTFQNSIFYGVDKIPSFAYAPSIGNASGEDFVYYPELVEKLKKVQIIGVRDQNTQEAVFSICGRKPYIVCDPTCLLDVSEYPTSEQRSLAEKYILIYSYSVPVSLQKKLKKYARERGYKLVAACMYQRWCDENICCKPLEFCELVCHAECVFTTTFHGAIFTLMYHKRCAIFASSKKLKDLLLWTDMGSVKIDEEIEYEKIKKLLDVLPDYTKYENKMQERRIASRKRYQAYLEESR